MRPRPKWNTPACINVYGILYISHSFQRCASWLTGPVLLDVYRLLTVLLNHRLQKAPACLQVLCDFQSADSFLPTQFPWASCVKPLMHLCFGLHRKEPSVFSHAEPTPQLWVRSTHSSMSVKKEHKASDSYWQLYSAVKIWICCQLSAWASSLLQ